VNRFIDDGLGSLSILNDDSSELRDDQNHLPTIDKTSVDGLTAVKTSPLETNHKIARDATFFEGDHPRNPDGTFGTGGRPPLDVPTVEIGQIGHDGSIDTVDTHGRSVMHGDAFTRHAPATQRFRMQAGTIHWDDKPSLDDYFSVAAHYEHRGVTIQNQTVLGRSVDPRTLKARAAGEQSGHEFHGNQWTNPMSDEAPGVHTKEAAQRMTAYLERETGLQFAVHGSLSKGATSSTNDMDLHVVDPTAKMSASERNAYEEMASNDANQAESDIRDRVSRGEITEDEAMRQIYGDVLTDPVTKAMAKIGFQPTREMGWMGIGVVRFHNPTTQHTIEVWGSNGDTGDAENGPPTMHARDLVLFNTSESEHSGLLVSLHLDIATAKKLKLSGGEDPKDMHITLCYCGDVNELGDVNVARAIVAVNQVVKASAPLQGTTTKLDGFDATEHSDGKNVVIARVDIPGLFELRQQLADALIAIEVPPRGDFEYTPHITLAYVPVEDALPDVEIPVLPLMFTEVRITIGDQTTDIPFGQAPRNLMGWMRHLLNRVAGGPGSGNFGHAGRPGEVGGSMVESAGRNQRMVNFTRIQADIVATKLGFDSTKIDVVYNTSPRTFYVGNRSFNEAGHYSPDTGRIEINANQMSFLASGDSSEIQGLAAHEITHDAFQQAFTRWNEPKEYDSMPPDEVQDLSSFIGDHADQLIKEDGVTDYSRAYWENARRMNPQSIDVGTWTPDTGGDVGLTSVGGDQQPTGWINQDTGEWRDQPPPPEKQRPALFDLEEDTPGYRAWSSAMNETFAEISALKFGGDTDLSKVSPVWKEAHQYLFAAYKSVVNTEVMTRGGFKKI
jgi:2'-5' RNA ligase